MSNDPSTSSTLEDDQDTINSTTITPSSTTTTSVSASASSHNSSLSKSQSAIQSLSTILPSLPPSLFSSSNPARSLLHDHHTASHISSLLRQPDSGAGDNNLCRWLYDTFQSSDPDLQLLVLRFLPLIAGIYISRVALRVPLAGFEAVLLALYAHETATRSGHSITVSVPTSPAKNNSTDLNLAVISPSLEPYGTVRSTRRARIVGVALELYYSKIHEMPVLSKIEFCQFCKLSAGQDGEMYKEMTGSSCSNRNECKEEDGNGEKEGRVPLPWELMQPVLRILGHCLLCPNQNKELVDKGSEACRSLYARSMHDINPNAILATGSLLRLTKQTLDSKDDFDPTEIPKS
ncbi:hypothetical protein PRUPE_6G113000 [Prunus persica]|uniref:Hyccin n=1 Tax=Prunus persica TaxID=3760 RepID=M5W3N2_PRUPE|nr:hypothetical protein PRUPE_6G113000 [Prunus persica]